MQMLETSRLLIRVETHEEYLAKFADADDATLKSYYGFATDEALQSQKKKVAGGFTTYRTTVQFFHLVLKSTEEVIGGISFHNWYPGLHRSELGYDIRTEANRNKGYMKEALPSVLNFGFSELKLNRVEAFTAPDNFPSRRLLEHYGFQQEGWLREHYFDKGEFVDSVFYGLLAKEWQGQ